ncbi:MAG: capsular polysaccharide biosynthesis protein, partial [Pseudomonadota bacterium]
ALTGLTPVRRHRSAAGLAAVGVWGRRPTAAPAEAAAGRAEKPVWRMEDGFFRSLAPGAAERSISYVLDRTGIYYDAAQPSDLEAMIRARAQDPAGAARDAAPALAALRAGLSKYNLFDAAPAFDGWPADPAEVQLLVDQTAGDASVAGAGASAAAFRDMLVAAAEAQPGGAIARKTQPETQTGDR